MSDKPDGDVDDQELLMRVARLFYLDDRSKVDIAGLLGISRFRVARMLETARRTGLVQIRISKQRPPSPLEQELRDKYDLEYVVVGVTHGASTDRSRWDLLGELAAHLLERVVTDGDVLGVGWGRTIQGILPHLTSLAHCPVVQLSGMTGGLEHNSTEVTRRFAAATKSSAYPIYAPLVLPTAETAAALRAQPEIAQTLAMHGRITVAVMAVGSWNPPNSQLRLQFSASELRELDALGLRSEMGGVLLNSSGERVESPLLQRILSIDPELLHRIPSVIGVAAGPNKVEAIHLAARSKYLNSLVTDDRTAASLLAL